MINSTVDKIEMKGLSGESLNILEEKINKIKEIFPEAICEGKIDFERLSEELGEFKEDKEERYRFEWAGKSEAIKISQTPSLGTLRPCKEESKDWDTTQNLYIEGDNLEVLKLLQKSYQNKVKMIYIDPPYNTGNDFVYKDDFKDNVENYLKITGQKDIDGNNVSTNKDTSGRYHSEWLNMIYPRLKIARNLLKEDGVIFISIDDNEVENLKKACNQIFGENNFVNQVVWIRNSSGKTVSKQLTVNIEYLLIYSKSENYKFNPIYKPLSEATIKSYSKDDNDGRGKYCTVSLQKTKDPGPETTYDYIDNNGKIWRCPAKGWRMIQSKVKKLEDDKRLYLEGDTLRVKMYWDERESKGKLADTLWDDMPENSVGSKELNKLFDNNIAFSNPKPIKYLTRLLDMQSDENAIVMDFFSGSASMAHAIMELNSKDNKQRKYIMVQIPEKINPKEIQLDEKKYSTLCEIGKERIRRAGDKIVSENKDRADIEDLDIGFKVFKLDSTNIKKWDPSNEKELYKQLSYMQDSFVAGRTAEDILYELMLKAGIDITYDVEVIEFNGKKIFNVGFGELIVCLSDVIDTSVAEEIVKHKNERTRVIFRESGFKDDSTKINVLNILGNHKIKEVMSI